MYDTVVIGGGVMGCSTALHLARTGMSVALLERGAVCRGASGVNAGTLTMHMTRAALIPYALRGWEMWTHARDWLGHDLEVQATDGLCVAFTDNEAKMLEQRVLARRERGAPIELISLRRARDIEPGLTNRVRAAAHCRIDGFNTPYLLGRAFLKVLAASGVRVRESCEVTEVRRGHPTFEIMAGGEPLRARRVVLAGGVWLERMLTWPGVTLPVKYLINQLAVTERMRPVMRSVLSVASGLLSLKQFANGTVLVGGGWQGSGDRETGWTHVIPENLVGNLQLARYTIPTLEETRIVRSWFGFEAEVADAMPLIGPVPGVPEAYVIGSVHSGYTSGPFMGQLLAQVIAGQEPELPLFHIDRLVS
jgi:glycine/D-amino acid oxidase-like deaminating enzyme